MKINIWLDLYTPFPILPSKNTASIKAYHSSIHSQTFKYLDHYNTAKNVTEKGQVAEMTGFPGLAGREKLGQLPMNRHLCSVTPAKCEQC